MKRCSKCILPESVPGIKFDSDGVCNYCHTYRKMNPKGEETLEEIFSRYRNNKDSNYACIMAYSGGRDSSYVLYQLVTRHKIPTLCLTIDCGLLTEFAFRNMERAKKILGVDQVILKINPEKFLKDIGKNIRAWLKRPSVAMIPIFTTFDKTANRIIVNFARRNKIPLIVSAGGSGIEDVVAKAGFAGVSKEPYRFNRFDAFKLVFGYLLEYLKNPYYFNRSLTYTIQGWFEWFIFRYPYTKEWLDYYTYVKWDEAKILRTIRKELDWESPQDTIQTWRTDDATSPWYNFLYYSMTGFTENDELLSNMIREGLVTREEASERVKKENQPRYGEIEKYLKMVGVDDLDIYELEERLNESRKKTFKC